MVSERIVLLSNKFSSLSESKNLIKTVFSEAAHSTVEQSAESLELKQEEKVRMNNRKILFLIMIQLLEKDTIWT